MRVKVYDNRKTTQDLINEEKARQNEDFNRLLKNAEDSMKAIYPEEYKKIRSRYFGNGNNLGLIGSQFNYIHNMITRNSNEQMKKYYNELKDYFIKQTGTQPGYMLPGVDVNEEAPDWAALRQKDIDRFYSPTENSDYLNTVEKQNARNAYLALQNKNADGTFDHDGYFDYNPDNGLLNTEANYARAHGSYNYTPEEREVAATWERAQNSPIVTAMEFSPLFPVVAGAKAAIASSAPQASGVDVGMNAAFAALPAVAKSKDVVNAGRKLLWSKMPQIPMSIRLNNGVKTTVLPQEITQIRVPKSASDVSKSSIYKINDIEIRPDNILIQHPNTLTRVLGTGTSGLEDAVTSGIIRGKPYSVIGSANTLNKWGRKLRKYDIPEQTVENFLSSNLTENDFNILKNKNIPGLFNKTGIDTGKFSLSKEALLPKTYEEYLAERNFGYSKLPKLKNEINYNPTNEKQIVENWSGEKPATFALSDEDVLNNNLFVGDYAVQLSNADKIGIRGDVLGHFPEHYVTKYPIKYDNPIVSFYKRIIDPVNNKNVYYKINPLEELTPDEKLPTTKMPSYATFGKNYDNGGVLDATYIEQINRIRQPRFAGWRFKDGGIYIKEENRGKFTEQAQRAGMTTKQFTSEVLENPNKYTPTTVKRARFSRNIGGN